MNTSHLEQMAKVEEMQPYATEPRPELNRLLYVFKDRKVYHMNVGKYLDPKDFYDFKLCDRQDYKGKLTEIIRGEMVKVTYKPVRKYGIYTPSNAKKTDGTGWEKFRTHELEPSIVGQVRSAKGTFKFIADKTITYIEVADTVIELSIENGTITRYRIIKKENN